jgi:hypothetical protein
VVKQTFQLARCGCTLRVTSQTSYSPEYITPHTQKSTFPATPYFSHREKLKAPYHHAIYPIYTKLFWLMLLLLT